MNQDDAAVTSIEETQPIADEPAPKGALWLTFLKWILMFLATSTTTAGATALALRPETPEPEVVAEIVLKDAKGMPGVPVMLQAETMGARVKWRAVTPGLVIVDDLPDLVSSKRALAFACRAGVYRVECWTALNNEPTHIYSCAVTIGDPEPLPPGPPPVPPGPTPPIPPIPPQPTNPLTVRLQAAYQSDLSPVSAKAGQKMLLQGLYEAMIEHAKKPEILTTSDLLADLKSAANGLIAPGALIEIRKVISAEISQALGTETSTRLDPDLRPRAVELFARIAKALSEVR